MSPSTDPTLATLILDNVRGYAVLTLDPDGTITNWLGDARALTGYDRQEAVGRHFSLLFTEADRAAGTDRIELETAARLGRAEDSRWHKRKDGTRFWANGLTLDLKGDEPHLVKIFRDETAAKEAEDQRVLLLNELNHRVKNTLATVQSIVEQTLRSSGVKDTIRADLTERLLALARAHNVLVDQNWAGADLHVLVQDAMAPHDRSPSPFRSDGPLVRLHPSQAVTLSMALHELTTNAIKYGALSVPDGRVKVAWNLAHDGHGGRHLVLMWQESGGPETRPPNHTGFGSRLIRGAFADQPGGRTEMRFEPEGLTCVIAVGLVEALDEATPGVGADPAL